MARLSGSNEDSIPPTQGADGTGLTMNEFFFFVKWFKWQRTHNSANTRSFSYNYLSVPPPQVSLLTIPQSS